MKWYWAIVATAGFFAVILMIPPLVGFALVLATVLWAAIDSSHLELKKYRSGIATGPVVLFIGVALLWIVGFPWYLIVRGKIREGRLPLKSASASGPAGTAPASASSDAAI